MDCKDGVSRAGLKLSSRTLESSYGNRLVSLGVAVPIPRGNVGASETFLRTSKTHGLQSSSEVPALLQSTPVPLDVLQVRACCTPKRRR